jgi:hypothetical protein
MYSARTTRRKKIKMPETEVAHYEAWTLTIRPGDGDEPWPVMDHPYRAEKQIQPYQVFVDINRGSDRPSVSVQGYQLKADGTPGRRQMSFGLYRESPNWLAWIAGLVEEARKGNDLVPGRTGVPW